METAPSFSKKEFRVLVQSFYYRCAFVALANMIIVFLIFLLLSGSVTMGGYAVLALCFCAGLNLFSGTTGTVRFPTPPFYRLPDTAYPFLVSEWSRRLMLRGFAPGPIAYRCDMSNEDVEVQTLIAVIPPGFIQREPTLVVSESFLDRASERTIVAVLEHEIGHLRLRTYFANMFTSTLATPAWFLLWVIVIFRVNLERGGWMYLAGKLYGCELYLHHASSQSFKHIFELIADALAAEALQSHEEYILALQWVEYQTGNDSLQYEHDEHLLTHPSLSTRRASLVRMFA